MPSPVTEVATITFKPGADLSSPSTPAAKAWSETLSTVSQQDGYQRAYWGHQLENPNIILLLIGTFAFPHSIPAALQNLPLEFKRST
jgi:uncharacterized alpha-E superfamily protein